MPAASKRKRSDPHACASRRRTTTATMAGTPSPNGRIVPVMAPRRPASRNASRPLRQQVLKGEAMDTEALKIQCLEELRLYAAPIKGDGNCLFYSLSDQLYGYPDYHEEIRQRLVDHVRSRSDYFMQFVSDVGGERRAPRRAAAAAVQARQSNNVGRLATDDGQRLKFEQMLSQMGKTGFWGGSMELQAFCQAYSKNIMVYTDHGVQRFTSNFTPDRREERQTLHVAYHSFEHYSSVRSVDGPHTGFPNLPSELGSSLCGHGRENGGGLVGSDSFSGEGLSDISVERSSHAPLSVAEPWKISSIAEALPEFDHDTIRSMLKQCRGDINNAFARLLDGDGSALPSDDTSTSATGGTIPRPALSTQDSGNSGAGSGSSQGASSSGAFVGSSSRSSSRHSTASKRSVDESDDEDPIRAPVRRRRGRDRDRKRRILQDVTVGISVRDEDENDVISIRLRVDPNTVAEQAADASATEASSGVGVGPRDAAQSDAEGAGTPARDNNGSGRSPLSVGQSSEATSDGDDSEYEDHGVVSDSDVD